MEAFAGQECFGAVTLTRGERSRVADLAADLL
jgi:predicted ribonuclease YlaK